MEAVETGYGRIITIILITILVSCLFFYQCWRIFISPWSHIPCVGVCLPLVGNLFSMPPREEMWRQLNSWIEKHGDTFVVWITHQPLVVTRDVDIFEKILNSNDYNDKGANYEFMRDWINDGLICSNGAKWKTRRKQLTSCFFFDVLKGYMETMQSHSLAFVSKLQGLTGQPVDVQQLTKPYSLGIICDSAMGVNLYDGAFEQRTVDNYIESIAVLSAMTSENEYSLLYRFRPLFKLTEKGKQYYKSIDVIHSFTRKVIEDKIASSSGELPETADQAAVDTKEDGSPTRCKMIFLDTLLHLYRRNEIDIDGIVEEMNNFVFAGHDTVATTLAWTLYHLGRDEKIQEKVFEEAVKADKLDADIHEKVKQLKYLECVIKESMRVRPTVPIVTRHISQDVEIKGKLIPRGTDVALFFGSLHRDERFWKDPMHYNPDRFVDTPTSDKRSVFSYLPFSAGSRNCIGQRFAMMELKISLYQIVLNFQLEALQGESELTEIWDIVLSSLEDLKVKFTKRV